MKNFLNVKFWFATGLKPDSFCQPAFYLTLINHVTKTFLKESSFSATYHYPFHIIQDWVSLNVMRCAIWYHLCNSKNVKNTHVGVLLLVKLQAEAWNFTKSNTRAWVFFTFFKLSNGTKSRNAWLLAPLFAVTVVSQQRRWKRSSNSDLASKREDVTCISLFIYICILVRANISFQEMLPIGLYHL